jgi:methanogenic corrinoid protein MtbC1
MSQGRTSLARNFERVFSLSGPLSAEDRGVGAVAFPNAAVPASRDDIEFGMVIERAVGRQLAKSAGDPRRIARFVALLMDEESDACLRMVDDIAQDSGDPQHIAEILFEPAARMIGENWCGDECDFMKVTIALSRMQRLFRHLASDFPPPVRADLTRCVLLAPAPGEQHLFGLSIVEDAFRRGGWEVDCCGFGEDAEIIRLATVNHYHIIGVTVSVDRHLPDIVTMVAKLRSKSLNRSVIVMAGGSMVMRTPERAADAGFDMLAVDAQSAVRLAETVVSRQGRSPDLRAISQ